MDSRVRGNDVAILGWKNIGVVDDEAPPSRESIGFGGSSDMAFYANVHVGKPR